VEFDDIIDALRVLDRLAPNTDKPKPRYRKVLEHRKYRSLDEGCRLEEMQQGSLGVFKNPELIGAPIGFMPRALSRARALSPLGLRLARICRWDVSMPGSALKRFSGPL
jgi:hypothetical protein